MLSSKKPAKLIVTIALIMTIQLISLFTNVPSLYSASSEQAETQYLPVIDSQPFDRSNGEDSNSNATLSLIGPWSPSEERIFLLNWIRTSDTNDDFQSLDYIKYVISLDESEHNVLLALPYEFRFRVFR